MFFPVKEKGSSSVKEKGSSPVKETSRLAKTSRRSNKAVQKQTLPSRAVRSRLSAPSRQRMPDRPTKITFAVMREMGLRGLLIYCADYRCSHSLAISGDAWPDCKAVR